MIIDEKTYLEHFGVKGMRWGVRRERPSGVSRRTDREASKDAKEFARAKMFFGEGAGNRRKLIKASVDAKKKKSSSYAKAFDAHLADQDFSRHAEKARSERSRKDTTKAVKRTGGAVARRVTGEMGTAAAFVGLAALGGRYLNSPQGRAKMSNTINKVRRHASSRRGRSFVNDFNNLVNRSGLG